MLSCMSRLIFTCPKIDRCCITVCHILPVMIYCLIYCIFILSMKNYDFTFPSSVFVGVTILLCLCCVIECLQDSTVTIYMYYNCGISVIFGVVIVVLQSVDHIYNLAFQLLVYIFWSVIVINGLAIRNFCQILP